MKAVLMLSGGIDSPVAGYLAKQRGVDLIALFLSNEPFTSKKIKDNLLKLAKIIECSYLIEIDYSKQLVELLNKCTHKYYYVLMRRLMFRIAEKVAKKNKSKFIITGENLAQVSSQTLPNMFVADKAIKMQILRPLLTNDKIETMGIARKIGTYESSLGPEMCCLLGPRHPATTSNLKIIKEEERILNISSMVNSALKTIKVKNL